MGNKAHFTLQSHCNICSKTVSVTPMLNRDDLVSALQRGLDVRVMHATAESEHVWSLGDEDKQHLSNALAKGLV
jgi:hypothetical protein